MKHYHAGESTHEHHHHNHQHIESIKEPKDIIQQVPVVESKRNVEEPAIKPAGPDKQSASGKLPPPLVVVNPPKRKKRDITSEEMQQKPPQKVATVEDTHEHHGSDVHSVVGLALVAGFVLMLLVDQLAQSRITSSTKLFSVCFFFFLFLL